MRMPHDEGHIERVYARELVKWIRAAGDGPTDAKPEYRERASVAAWEWLWRVAGYARDPGLVARYNRLLARARAWPGRPPVTEAALRVWVDEWPEVREDYEDDREGFEDDLDCAWDEVRDPDEVEPSTSLAVPLFNSRAR